MERYSEEVIKSAVIAVAIELRRLACSAETDVQRSIYAELMHTLEDKSERKKYSDDFERLWKLYPRKAGKDKAFIAYRKVLRTGVTSIELERALNEWKRTSQWEANFIPYMANWIKDDKWREDTRKMPKAQQPQYMKRSTDALGGFDPTEELEE